MVCFSCGRFGHDADGCKAKQQEEVTPLTAQDVEQPSQAPKSNNEEEKKAGYGPWMMVKKPPRRNHINKQMNGKDKVVPPSNTQGGSRFAVLNEEGEAQESDEIVPNTFDSNVQHNANPSSAGHKLQGDYRKQFQKNLQQVAKLANKGNASGNSLAGNKNNQGPKIATSDKVVQSSAAPISLHTVDPKPVLASPSNGQDVEPINVDNEPSQSENDPSQNPLQEYVNLGQRR